ncbi:hypothetical protein BKA65DRAFT_270444 [Rhexocercosporidium sp. MPI-PUGE-AT-0058]|nr:hypothetical protein BKA65DRAFT_270444 [Rhexocercosporidium sp. MPI-PUGE-AT-0058]
MKTSTFLSALAASAKTVVAQDFIANGNTGNILSCRGSQSGNAYCCFDGTFSGPAWNGLDSRSSSPSSDGSSMTLVRKSEITIRQNKNNNINNNMHKRDIVTEMSSGLTCSGFAAITLTNSDASALLASATSAADAEGDGIESTSLSRSQVVTGTPTSSEAGETRSQTMTSSATVESASASVSASAMSTSTNGGAMATKAPLLVVGGAVMVMGYAL